MKTAIRWTTLLLLLCSTGAAFANDREDRTPRRQRGTVIFDGVEFAPGEFKRPDHALTMVVTREDAENGTMHIFSSREVAGAFMNRLMDREFGKDRGKGLKRATAASCTPWANEYSAFNKNPGCGGSVDIFMDPGEQYTQLDSISWNNSISCVKAACIDAWTTIYACRNFQLTTGPNCDDPDALFIFPGVILDDLNDTTPEFNNRTSSMRFCTVFPTCN